MGSLAYIVVILGEQTKVKSVVLSLAQNEEYKIDGSASLIVISSKGTTFTGSAIFNSGYGITQAQIRTIFSTISEGDVGVGG